MRYNRVKDSDIEVSLIGLGGHEFLPGGTVKAMGEDFHASVTRGAVWDGFGRENRVEILQTAWKLGINLLDVTIDSEKEALARNLASVPPPFTVYVHRTRTSGHRSPCDMMASRRSMAAGRASRWGQAHLAFHGSSAGRRAATSESPPMRPLRELCLLLDFGESGYQYWWCGAAELAGMWVIPSLGWFRIPQVSSIWRGWD
ncbi:MAG: hypothetical protein GF331_13760 [Chitinivibrionales bacterium]|nr:hypothetical protein [Chitinivibrionales bacterium]